MLNFTKAKEYSRIKRARETWQFNAIHNSCLNPGFKKKKARIHEICLGDN